MPPRKEPKESVVYPSSKRKTPAFKPLRPSKVPRTESESSTAKPKDKSVGKKPAAANSARSKSIPVEDSEEDEDSETLEDNPLVVTRKKSKPTTASTKNARPQRARSDSLMSISSHHSNDPPDDDVAAIPSQSDSIPSIPQPLLVRLLHEAFADKSTKIDTHAIQVLQKYVEIFVREAIARTEAEKREAAEKGDVGEMDAGWLEAEDLEKVVAGLLLDF